MVNSFDTTQGLPSQRDASWWSKVIQAMQGNPMTPEDTDYGMWGSILGRGAQAISAQDPKSWQHQLGGLGAEIGQAHKMAQIQEADKKRRDEFRSMLLKALGISIPPPEEVEEEPEKESLMSLGGMDSKSLIEMYLGR